jgi:cation transporter-like permease
VARETTSVVESAETSTGTPMQFLAYAMIIAVLVVEYVHRTFQLHKVFALVPDMLSAIAALVVLAKLPMNRFRDIDARYVIVFALLLFNFIAGAVLNELEPGVVVAGIRKYFLAILYFFVPLVVHYDDRALRKQLGLITVICLIQFPLAYYQRVTFDAISSSSTGDYVFGTLLNSGVLSIFLCCVASVAIGLYLRGCVRLRTMILFLAMTLPATMINESKGTLVLIPIAVLGPIFLAGMGSTTPTFKRVAFGTLILACFVAVFVPVYDKYRSKSWGEMGLMEFVREGRLTTYMYRDVEIGSEKRKDGTPNIDAMLLPFKAFGTDIPRCAFGFGMGNVSDSSLGQGFAGEHVIRYGKYVGPNISVLLWETGIFGVILVLWLHYRIFKEALVARRADGLPGALALGWCGVVLLMSVSLAYKQTMNSNALSYLFWFYSGAVSAMAMRVRRADTPIGSSRVRLFAAPPIQGSLPRSVAKAGSQ